MSGYCDRCGNTACVCCGTCRQPVCACGRPDEIAHEDDLAGMLPNEILAVVRRLTAERDDARAAIMALARRSPFFVTIDPKGDIEICQFCGEDGRHAPDCPWLLVEAVAAGKPAFPTPAQIAALYQADEALTAVFNAARRIDLGDLIVQVDRAISACRTAGTRLPWPGEASGV